MSRVSTLARIALPATIVAILLISPASALAEDPPDAPETIFSAGFESADASITLQPTPDIASSAYWGRITGSKRSGSYGLWCAGSNPSNWDPYIRTYPVNTRGQALMDLAVLADYYDSWLEYWYVLPSRGGGDTSSFNVGWYANDDPGDWDTFSYFGLTSTWVSRTEELSSPYNSPGVSREAATIIFEFNDKVDTAGAAVGQGATVDDVTITGYRFGPARSLAATAGSSAVPISWEVPWASRAKDVTEDRLIKYRVWRRSHSPGAGAWQEVTSGGGQTATDATDAFPPSGVDLEYRVHVWEDGGSGYSDATTITVDQPPAVSDDATDTYDGMAAQITIEATDTVDGVGAIYYVLDGDTTQTVAANSTLLNVSQWGDHVLTYWATDGGGVASDQVTRMFTVDTAPHVSDDAPSGYSTSDPTTVTITAVGNGDGVDSISYSLDGAATQTVAASSVSLAVSTEGTHTLSYFAESLSGAMSDVESAEFTIDSVAPATTDDAPSGWQTAAVDVTLTPSDATSGVDTTYYRVNSGSWQTYSSAIAVTSDGATTIEYYSTDVAGNTETTGECTVQLDATAPSTTDDAPSGWQTSAIDVTLTPSDATSGVDTTYYRVNSGSWQTYSSAIAVTTDGATTIEYYSTDVAGNTETTGECTVQLDTTAPATTDDAPSGWQTAAVNVTLTPSDATSGVDTTYYRVNSGSWQTYSSAIAVTSDGATTIEYYSTDVAGNTETGRTTTVMIDRVAPTSDWDGGSGSPTYYGAATIALTASDADSGVESISYILDGGSAQTVTGSSAQVNVTALGSHTLEFWATDDVGNPESPHNSKSFDVRSGGTDRLADDNRFSTAVEIAREGWADGGSDWDGVTAIIIASGDDAFAADPLSASGLSWTYDAPLFLVSAYRSTSTEVKMAIKEIAQQAPGAVDVYVVGGTVSAPQARVDEIRAYVGSAGSLQQHRLAGSNRYDTARLIALEVMKKHSPDTVLVANGANPASFYDALALSPIAAANGYPVLPVSKDSISPEIKSVLNAIDPDIAVIGGGTAVVSDSVKREVDGIAGTTLRWSGQNRYETATTIASNALSRGMLAPTYSGVAAGLPDALTGGSMVGSKGGPLVLTSGTSLTSVTGNWIAANNDEIAKCYIFGGTAVLKPAVKDQIEAKLKQ